ncbi:MAG: prolipoprotein diacylglyceryl transferase [Planctomycetes bacterium]|nr:prolipoprotein diacylglyceryl transferase [Planctomycetota bacterium]
MRQILLRIRFDNLFMLEPYEHTTAVGAGWLIGVWVLGVVLWSLWRRGAAKTGGELARAIASRLVLPLVLLAALAAFGSRFPKEGLPIFGYGFMLFCGFILGGWTAARRARRAGLPGEVMWDLGMWMFFAGLAGARLFYILQYPQRVFYHEVEGTLRMKEGWELLLAVFNLPDGGLVALGSVPTAVVAGLVFCRLRKVRPLVVGDLAMPSVFIGLGLGRIGCLLNGCCYGDRSDLPWAIQFPKGGGVTFKALELRGFLPEDAAWTFPLHPTQIYSSINAFVLAGVCAILVRKWLRPGLVMAFAWVAYPISRFLIEFLRGDEMGKFGTELTISQWYSLALFASGLVFTIWLGERSLRESPSAERVAAMRSNSVTR